MTAKKSAKKTAKSSATKSPSFRKGETVTWETSQGETEGTVERKLTAPMQIKGHEVAASPDNPEYLVKSKKTGAKAAHKPSALHKKPKRS